MIICTDSGIPIVLGSCVFYGFRFTINTEQDFDYDSFLSNKDEVEGAYNCSIVVVDELTRQYALVLRDTYSYQSCIPPKFYISKTFAIREISDNDLENMKKVADFFNIKYQIPAWRHAMCRFAFSIAFADKKQEGQEEAGEENGEEGM